MQFLEYCPESGKQSLYMCESAVILSGVCSSDHVADWEVPSLPLPSMVGEEGTLYCEPRKRSEFKIQSMTSEHISLLYHCQVKNLEVEPS